MHTKDIQGEHERGIRCEQETQRERSITYGSFTWYLSSTSTGEVCADVIALMQISLMKAGFHFEITVFPVHYSCNPALLSMV